LVELPGDTLLGGGVDEIRIWNLHASDDDKGCLRIIPNKGVCSAIVLLNNEDMACASGNDINIMKIYGSEVPLKRLVGHSLNVRDLLLHSNRLALLSSSADDTVRLWNVRDGSCTSIYEGNALGYQMLWYKENVVAVACYFGEIKFWDVVAGECVRTLTGKDVEKGVYGLAIDSNGVLVSCGEGAVISFWSNW